jgi:alpha-tubulin suppressor-like RCC1 family protein
MGPTIVSTAQEREVIFAQSLSSAVKVVAGVQGACVVNHDKSAACWGANDKGQIVPNADGSNNVVKAPVVLGLVDVREVMLSQQNLCAVTGTSEISSVLCRGINNVGQLGNGTTEPSSNFETVKGLPASIRGIGVGSTHACAVTGQGATFCWGDWGQGQAGDPAETNATEATPVGGNASVGVIQVSSGIAGSLAVRDDGAILAWGGVPGVEPPASGQTHLPRFVAIGDKGLSVSTMISHTCAIAEGGAVWCFGYSPDGRAGVDCPEAEPCTTDYLKKPVRLNIDWAATQVAVGAASTCALAASNEVYCWGYNMSGQVGVGHVSEQEPPSKVVWK